MADAPMPPEEYAEFMGEGLEEEDSAKKKKKDDRLDSDTIHRIRMQMKQAGVTTDNIDRVAKGVGDIGFGELREFNFVRGHVRRVRIRRELGGKITVITY